MALILTALLLNSFTKRARPIFTTPHPTAHSSTTFDEVVACSIKGLDKSSLDAPLVEPIPFDEYVQRRDRIAHALVEEGLDAYIVEPGADFTYLANLTSWEDWGPTERPFLLIIEPIRTSSNRTRARSTILTPAFELIRAKQLVMPFAHDDADFLVWQEAESPYEVLASFLAKSSSSASSSGSKKKTKIGVKVGPETRTFITQGISAIPSIHLSPYTDSDPTSLVRQTKSTREVAIIRAINTLTVKAIRSVRLCAYDGISELEVYNAFKQTVLSAGHGIRDVEGLALFGERTACPHCGPSAERKLRASEDFILMDVGARLYGLISDCTRTFLLPNASSEETFDKEKLNIWYTVHKAQTAAIHTIREGVRLNDVDHAARTVIDKAGYGKYFTHRLGHSIGLQMHENPYANSNPTNRAKLQTNTPLTAEPGIYIEGFAGVRIEDVILTNAGGKEAETLTNRRASSPWDP
ncbi:hypothetical protein V8E36_003930 [Tilletia maclaganii]